MMYRGERRISPLLMIHDPDNNQETQRPLSFCDRSSAVAVPETTTDDTFSSYVLKKTILTDPLTVPPDLPMAFFLQKTGWDRQSPASNTDSER